MQVSVTVIDIEEKRRDWAECSKSIEIEHLVFLDESRVNTDMTRRYGRAVGKARAEDHAPLNTPQTTTVLSSMRLDGSTATVTYSGGTTGVRFVDYLKTTLLPTLRPGDIVVMDHLRSHHVKDVQKLFEGTGFRVVYLPPYSPDLNPIEKMWSKMKAILRNLKDIKPRTADSYRSTAKNHLKPALGRIRLKALTPVQVQVFINELFEGENGEGGLSAKTVHNIHGVLHRALQDAVSIGYLKYNVADNTKLPRKSKPEIHPMDKDDVARFLTEIQDNELETLFRTALFTGMRQGELLGLTWNCVDFVNGTITVSKQLQRKRDGSGEYELITPKNNKPRTLTPASDVMVRLHRLQTRQMEQRLMAGSTWENEQGFVFVNELGRHLAAHTVYLKFKKVVEDMGMPDFRFHDLRHTFAVMSLQAGDDIKTLQENMGE